jgi:hypothetical protein
MDNVFEIFIARCLFKRERERERERQTEREMVFGIKLGRLFCV